MRLATRMGLLGAIVPAALFVIVFLAAGQALDWMLIRAVDDGLTGEALVESVSLFDVGDGAPHLHLDRNPLVGKLGESATARAVYGPTGGRILVWPASAPLPAMAAPEHWSARPVIRTETVAGRPARVLRLQVHSHAGKRHGLLLARSLADVENTLLRYRQAAGGATALAVLLLLMVQRWQSTWLQRRLDRLSAHMSRLESDDLSEDPAPDTVHDELTELRHAMAAATERLRTARATRDRLIADAAHELRTPLTAIRLEIDLALRRERTQKELAETLVRLRDESERLSVMTHDLLDLAALRAAPKTFEPLPVEPVLAAAARRAALTATASGVTLTRSAIPVLMILGSAEELGRALDNLLANAMRFAAPQGEDGANLATAGGHVQLSARLEQNTVIIAVQDNGPGVGDADTQGLFAPFHRRDRRGSGTGLGLAIVADICARHGGSVAFARDSTHGARVEMRFKQVAIL